MSVATGHFSPKRGHAVLLFPLLCPHIVKWFPSLCNLAANTAESAYSRKPQQEWHLAPSNVIRVILCCST